MSAAYRPGEVVNVTIKGVAVHEVRPNGQIHIRDEHKVRYTMPAQAAIERVPPASWPPQRGDLWEDYAGGRWFTVVRGGEMRMHADNGVCVQPQVLLEDAPLTLVSRDRLNVDEVPF